MNLKKIICPIDITDPVPAVADHARSLAELTGATVIALCVVKLREEYNLRQLPIEDEDAVQNVITKTKAALADYVAHNFSGVKVTGMVREGDPAEIVLAIAEKEQTDMIIMGSHGRRGIGRLLFGSVATEVTQKAMCPVLTIRPKR